MALLNEGTSIEWFGTTTFRLKTKGLTIFLDTHLERPSSLPRYLSIDDVEEADYICISHAHFDHLPGADRLALRTGAVVIANGEAINILRRAGVPSGQLISVSGGERVPLYTRSTRIKAAKGEIDIAPGPASAPRVPHPRFAVTSIHVWPSLHGLIPGSYPNLPDVLDTGVVYEGEAHPYTCTLDITRGMEHGLLKMQDWLSPEKRSPGQQSFIDYIKDTDHNLYSHFDGGQLMFNILVEGDKAVLWNAHLGAYEGIMKTLEPKPDVLIMGIAGRVNHNGRPYNGSAAEYVTKVIQWLDDPKTVIWCLHDEYVIAPFSIETGPATSMVEGNTRSRVLDLKPAEPVQFEL